MLRGSAPVGQDGSARLDGADEGAGKRTVEGVDRLGDVDAGRQVPGGELGRKVLERLCPTPALQRLATQAARNTLAIADELSTLAERSTGMHSIPVS